MVEQRSDGIVVLTNTERQVALKGAQSLTRIQDHGRLEALTVVLELTTTDAIRGGSSIHEWRIALATRRNLTAPDEDVINDILKTRAALKYKQLDVRNISDDPRNRRDGGVYRFAEDTIRKFLEAGVNLPTDNQTVPKVKENTPPVVTTYAIRAILDKMPDEHAKSIQLAPQLDLAPRRRKGIRKETPEERRLRELEEKKLAIQALEDSISGRLYEPKAVAEETTSTKKVEPSAPGIIQHEPIKTNQQLLAQRERPERGAPPRRKSRTETKIGLASGFKESISTDKTIRLTRKELPWLKKVEEIRLALITLSDTNEPKFYFGSVIRGKLAEAAFALTVDQNRHADSLLNTYLPDFVRRKLDLISRLSYPATGNPIYYLGNAQGQRVYFMESDQIEGLPVIIRIAVCDKAEQDEVLSVLTNTSRSFIKSRSGL